MRNACLSIKTRPLILLALTATLIMPASLTLGHQSAQAQQASCNASDFIPVNSGDRDYTVMVPRGWIGPLTIQTQGGPGFQFQSPDRTQIFGIYAQIASMYSLEQLAGNELQVRYSQGQNTVQQPMSVSWQGIYPAQILIFDNLISIWIQGNFKYYNIIMSGGNLNDPTVSCILSSFQIVMPDSPKEVNELLKESKKNHCMLMMAAGGHC